MFDRIQRAVKGDLMYKADFLAVLVAIFVLAGCTGDAAKNGDSKAESSQDRFNTEGAAKSRD